MSVPNAASISRTQVGAGDVDLGQVIADDVESHEDEPLLAQHRAHLSGDCAHPLRDRQAHALGTGREVSACVTARRDPGERVVHRFAVDQEDPRVTAADFRDVALAHRIPCLLEGQRLEDDVHVRVARAHAEDRHAAHCRRVA